MKLPSISSLIHDKRGEIGTIAVLIGMVVVGLGILVGSQIRNQNINIGPRASANIDPLWNGALSSKTKDPTTDVYLWTNGGPTTGWESYIGNRAYLCNGKWCWTLNRDTAPPTWEDGGKPFNMEIDPAYVNVQPIPGTDIKPGSQGGPTAAWTWILPNQMNGYTVNETLICKGVYCWRYIRYPNGANQTSGWRDGGAPLNMKEAGIWKDDTKMWAGSGLSVGWNDPINGKATVCNESQNYCRSMNYKNNDWRWLNDAVTYPSGVTKFTSAWTSPATKIQTRCTANSCYNFNTSTNAYEGSAFLIAAQPSTAPIDSCNSSADCMKCGSTCINKTAEMACTAMVQNFTCSCVSNKCVKVDSPPQTGCIPTLNLPTNNATVTSNPNFSWSSCSGSTKYRIEVTGDNAPSGVLFVGTQYSFTSPVPSWRAGSTYSWKVKACPNADCIGGTFSNPSTFIYGQQAGSLKVVIPNAPTGAQWQRTNTAGGWDGLRNNNSVDPAVPVGTYKVRFADVTGYTKPSETSVTITNGQTTTLNAQPYVRQVGSIQITIPGSVSEVGWRVKGSNTAWRSSKYTETNLPTGKYTVEFKPVTGYTTPNEITNIDVTNGGTNAKTSGEYVIVVPTCKTDSDGGNKPDIAGSITLSNGEYRADSCSGAVLTEYYCSGTTATSAQHTCQYGCGAFKCNAPPVGDPISTIGNVTLISPINAVTLPIGNVNLKWNAATSATSYEWSVNRSSRGFKTGTGVGTTAVLSLLPGSYTWQVTAKNATGSKASALGEFKIPFSKIKPLNNTQITYGSTYSFEWTPLLPTDMNMLYFMVYNSASSTQAIYYREIRTNSTEYTTGKLSLAMNNNTDEDFISGRTYKWQLIASRAGAASEHNPPNDNTESAQSFSLVPASATIPPPTPTIDCPKKPQGDANCDGFINLADYSCIVGELSNRKPPNCISSNFDNAGGDRPTSADYTIWSNSYNPRN